MDNNYLTHHGILGQEWGKRNGPPYPLGGGDYSQKEKNKIYAKRAKHPNSIYNKRHFDEVLRSDKTTLSTLSYNKDRLKGADMFYATHKSLDKHQYNALFNAPVKDATSGDTILKFRIDTKIKHNIKVASEDSGAEIFRQLYKKDRDFYNFVNDKNRMQKYFVQDKYKFKGYREARDVLDKMKDPKYIPTASELQKAYRLFNYVIPYDGGGTDDRGGKDVKTQRIKFFNALKEAGYGAVLDTNDAIYGGFKATSPIIVFDMSQIVPDSVYKTTVESKAFSTGVLAGRKILGV